MGVCSIVVSTRFPPPPPPLFGIWALYGQLTAHAASTDQALPTHALNNVLRLPSSHPALTPTPAQVAPDVIARVQEAKASREPGDRKPSTRIDRRAESVMLATGKAVNDRGSFGYVPGVPVNTK